MRTPRKEIAMGIMDDAKKVASEHEDQTDKAIEKAGATSDKTDGKYDDNFEAAESKAADAL
jgi:hypothetical protein